MAASIGVTTGQQKDKFQQRLKRIEKGGRYTSQHVYCGPEEEVQALQAGAKKARRVAGAASGPSAMSRVVGRLIGIPLAVAIGAAAVVGARILRVSFVGGGLTGENAVTLLAWDVGIAVVLALILRMIFRFRGAFQLLTVAGMAAAVVLMHNLVHLNPELWSTLFTADWVKTVLSETTANSVLLADKTYAF